MYYSVKLDPAENGSQELYFLAVAAPGLNGANVRVLLLLRQTNEKRRLWRSVNFDSHAIETAS